MKASYEPWEELQNDCEDLLAFYELTREENSDSYDDELQEKFDDLKKRFKNLQRMSVLSHEVDKNDAYLTIHAGAGGTEACD